jgi:glycosyltransferase involved in cell wall biosynthesis
MPSMVQEGKTGLHFPPGDAGVLAYQLRKVFLDDELARGLGRQARAMALKRHDPQTVADRIMEVYRQVLIKTETYPKAK